MEKKCSCKKDALKSLFPSLKKRAQPKEKKAKVVKEYLKDVYIIPSPKIKTVPVKRKRQAYYENGLVMSALTLTNEMSEIDVRVAISARLDEKFPPICPDFTFVKAVGDTLIETDVETYDAKTIRHLFGQGPIYIRTLVDLPVAKLLITKAGIDDNNDSDHHNEDSDQFDADLDNDVHKNNFHHYNQLQSENAPGSSSGKTDGRNAVSACPICGVYFPISQLESHCAQCASAKFDIIRYSDDEMMERKTKQLDIILWKRVL